MDRLALNLGIERVKDPLYIREWKYMYVGDCTGDVLLKFDNQGWVDPNEFETLVDLKKFYYLYVSNAAQDGEELVLYYEEGKSWLSHTMRRLIP